MEGYFYQIMHYQRYINCSLFFSIKIVYCKRTRTKIIILKTDFVIQLIPCSPDGKKNHQPTVFPGDIFQITIPTVLLQLSHQICAMEPTAAILKIRERQVLMAGTRTLNYLLICIYYVITESYSKARNSRM